MKILVLLLSLSIMLCGCSSPTYETMGDVMHVGNPNALPQRIILDLPADASVLTASGSDMLYTCTDYTMCLQILPAGDISETVRTLSGYDLSELTLMQTQCNDHARYDWVWVAAGENGDVLCRGAILDDGNFHYTLNVFANAEEAGGVTQTWNALFQSFCLNT